MKIIGQEEYKKILHTLSERIVIAQREIRILNAIKWPPDIKAQFFKKNCQEMPKVDLEMYQTNPLEFDAALKIEEFYSIERDIRRQLGQFSGIGNIMIRMCREYREVIRMLQARGTPEFSKISQPNLENSN